MTLPIDEPIRPKRLKPGATIGAVAPSSPFDEEGFRKGVDCLKAMGFHVVVAEGIFQRTGYLAGSDAHRAEMVNRFFTDRRIDAIMCARGGFGATRILPLLDFEAIRKNPKIFVGFSDTTAILSAIYTRCNLVTFHGPVVASLAKASAPTVKAFETAVTSGGGLKIKPRHPVRLRSGWVKAPVAGGNLTLLTHLLGTPYQPDFERKILFVEDCNEALYRIDRKLTHMNLAGCFQNLGGVMLGTFEGCGEMMEIHDLVARTFREHDIPILGGFAIGHGPENITLPLGVPARLDADSGELRIESAPTAAPV